MRRPKIAHRTPSARKSIREHQTTRGEYMSARTLPKEWESLPRWVKEELLYGSEDLPFYSWHIQRLVDHGENMKAVWRLLEKHRQSFTWKGPVHSLLCLLHEAVLGLDPGQMRSDDDRQTIANAVRKHADGLTTYIKCLGTGSPFGLYPFGIASTVGITAWEKAEETISKPFRSAAEEIQEVLDRAGVPKGVRKSMADRLESLQFEIEQEFAQLYSDPRETLMSLADGALEWARD